MTDSPTQPQSSQIGKWLGIAQLAMLFMIGFAGVISSPRQVLVLFSGRGDMPIEFQSLSISIPDFFLIAALLLTAVRLVIDSAFRAHLGETLRSLFIRYGGVFWVLLVIWMGVGLLWAKDPVFVRFATGQAIFALIGAFLVADFVRRGHDRELVFALLLSAVIEGVIAVGQFLHRGPLGLGFLGEVDRFWYDNAPFYRATGLSMHPNYLGGYMMLCLFAAILVARRRLEFNRPYILPVLVGGAAGVGLIATMSRSALLATVVGLIPALTVAIMSVHRKIARTTLYGLIGVGVALVIWGGVVLLPNADIRLFSPREFFFTDTFTVIQKSPVLGVGASNLMPEIAQLYPEESPTPRLPVHNVFMLIWAELGIPGLVLFSLGCLAIIVQMRPGNGISAFTWAACFLAICVVNLFDNYFWAIMPMRVIFFWAIGLWWGFALRADEHRRQHGVGKLPIR